jgi:hypothetical protein
MAALVASYAFRAKVQTKTVKNKSKVLTFL